MSFGYRSSGGNQASSEVEDFSCYCYCSCWYHKMFHCKAWTREWKLQPSYLTLEMVLHPKPCLINKMSYYSNVSRLKSNMYGGIFQIFSFIQITSFFTCFSRFKNTNNSASQLKVILVCFVVIKDRSTKIKSSKFYISCYFNKRCGKS